MREPPVWAQLQITATFAFSKESSRAAPPFFQTWLFLKNCWISKKKKQAGSFFFWKEVFTSALRGGLLLNEIDFVEGPAVLALFLFSKSYLQKHQKLNIFFILSWSQDRMIIQDTHLGENRWIWNWYKTGFRAGKSTWKEISLAIWKRLLLELLVMNLTLNWRCVKTDHLTDWCEAPSEPLFPFDTLILISARCFLGTLFFSGKLKSKNRNSKSFAEFKPVSILLTGHRSDFENSARKPHQTGTHGVSPAPKIFPKQR